MERCFKLLLQVAHWNLPKPKTYPFEIANKVRIEGGFRFVFKRIRLFIAEFPKINSVKKSRSVQNAKQESTQAYHCKC